MNIFQLVERGDTLAVADALDKGVANPNAMSQSSQGEFLIHIAAGTGNVPMLECLIQRGAKIHATTQRLLTPLHYAARMGHVEAVNYLIMQGATINAVDNLMWTPLHYAAYHGQAGVVELLLKSGASPNDVDTGKRSPLHLACTSGYSNVAVLLLKANASFTDPDSAGKYALGHLRVKTITPPTSDPEPITQRAMCQDMRSLYNSELYSDLKVQVDDHVLFAHRNIIHARCPVLLANVDEHNVARPGLSWELVRAIIEFIYSATVTFDNGEVEVDFLFHLLNAAEQLNLRSLATFCESTIVNSTDETTATTMLEQSRKHKATRVEDFCCWFIITKMDKIARMFALQPDFVGSVLLKVATEPAIQPPLDSVPALGSSSRTKVKDEYGAPPAVNPAQIAKMKQQALQRPPTSPAGPMGGMPMSSPNMGGSGTIAADRKKRSPNDGAYSPNPVATAAPQRPKPSPQPHYGVSGGGGGGGSSGDQLVGRNLESAKKIIKALRQDLDAPAFAVPVDPVALLIPDYPYIITKPMDLSTVAKKLNAKQYRTMKEWSADVRQIWENARVYNRPDSVIALQADRLSQLFEAQYAGLKSEAGLDPSFDPYHKKEHSTLMAIYQKGVSEYQRATGVALQPPGMIPPHPQPAAHQNQPRPQMPRPPAAAVAQQQYAPVAAAGPPKAQKPKPPKRKADDMTPTPQMVSPHVQNGGSMNRPQNPYGAVPQQPSHAMHPQQQHLGHPMQQQMGGHIHPGMQQPPQAPFPPEELEFLSSQLNNLNEAQVQTVIEIMQLAANEDGEYEINIMDLPPHTLRKLQQFVYSELKIPEKRFKPNGDGLPPQW